MNEASRLMAAHEARVAWQRKLNHHTTNTIKEDSSGQGKLSGSPSSSSKSESQDAGSETKWWLNHQPTFGPWNDTSYLRLNYLEAEREILSPGSVSQTFKLSEGCNLIEEYCTQTNTKANIAFCLDQPESAISISVKNDQYSTIQELQPANFDIHKASISKEIGEFWNGNDHLLDLDSYSCIISEQPEKLCSDMESHWVDKREPWWHLADKDEFDSLSSHRMFDEIENYEPPHLQAGHLERKLSYNADQDNKPAAPDQIANALHRKYDNMQGAPTSVNTGETTCFPGAHVLVPHVSDIQLSSNDDHTLTEEHKAETEQKRKSDLSKAQLLEALCHSQTRAREAEKAAKQAYDEKEHVLKLFFRQASHLFAYKQWLQILQLEMLCLHPRGEEQPIGSFLPTLIPWIPYKCMQTRKGHCKAVKRSLGPSGCKVSKCSVAFAVGLSLASAGLLLGWTMGWLFPSF